MMGSGFIFKYKKSPPPIRLSLVALMDIFTILVFFLLMNSGESQKIENAKFIKLPDSASTISPHADLKLFINDENIWLEDEIVANVPDVAKAPEQVIPSLAEALIAHVEKRGKLSAYETSYGLGVTIMAQKDVPYTILKSVMMTCAGENFRDISLAVNQIAGTVFPNAFSEGGETGSGDIEGQAPQNIMPDDSAMSITSEKVEG